MISIYNDYLLSFRDNLAQPKIRAYRPKPPSDKYSRSRQNNRIYNSLNGHKKEEELDATVPVTTTESQNVLPKNQFIVQRANFEDIPTVWKLFISYP